MLNSAKLKTTNIQAWIDIHTDWYRDGKVETSEHAGTTTIRVKKQRNDKNRLTIKFHRSGVILAQGENMVTWALATVPQMKVKINTGIAAKTDDRPQITFKGHDDILSNFHNSPISYEGKTYPSIENCYQAMKLKHHKCPKDKIKSIAEDTNPYNVKKMSNEIVTDEEWEAGKLDLMYKLVMTKSTQCGQFAKHLASTDGHSLIHDVTDPVWGHYSGGVNAMGCLLEQIRTVITDRNKLLETTPLSEKVSIQHVPDQQTLLGTESTLIERCPSPHDSDQTTVWKPVKTDTPLLQKK